MKGAVIAGGVFPSEETLKKYLTDIDYLICADSGANSINKLEIKPDILVGDFDSIDKKVIEKLEKAECEILKFPPEKNYTDTELALSILMEKGCNHIVLLGCTGGRMDHFMANLILLKKCMIKNIKSVMIDDYNEIRMINKNVTIEGKKGDYFSLYSYGDKVEGLSIDGAKYPLSNYTLENSDGLVTSNEFLGDKVQISLIKGELILIKSND